MGAHKRDIYLLPINAIADYDPIAAMQCVRLATNESYKYVNRIIALAYYPYFNYNGSVEDRHAEGYDIMIDAFKLYAPHIFTYDNILRYTDEFQCYAHWQDMVHDDFYEELFNAVNHIICECITIQSMEYGNILTLAEHECPAYDTFISMLYSLDIYTEFTNCVHQCTVTPIYATLYTPVPFHNDSDSDIFLSNVVRNILLPLYTPNYMNITHILTAGIGYIATYLYHTFNRNNTFQDSNFFVQMCHEYTNNIIDICIADIYESRVVDTISYDHARCMYNDICKYIMKM